MPELHARTIEGNDVVIPESALAEFRASLGGVAIVPGDDGYDEARAVWNGMIDRRPVVIARCSGVADVIASVRFAQRFDLLTAIRGGGHNVAGNAVCDDGLVIDLSHMRSVRVDPISQTARVEAGARLGDLDRETAPFGLVVPAGIVTETGVAGLTLGGGVGWLSRAWGLTCDNLVSADVVTADGNLVQASSDSNSDLFWALKGGGGNFGVVTSFEFKCHKFGPMALAGVVFYPFDQARAVLDFFREYTSSAPDEVTSIAILRKAPAAPFLPESIHGKLVVAIGACFAGPPEGGAELLRPIKEFGTPLADVLVPKPFVVHQSMLDAGQPSGAYYYWRSHYFDQLSDDALDSIVECSSRIESPMSILALGHGGAAVARSDESASAYPNRKSNFFMNINGSWANPAENDRHIGWVRASWDGLRPFANGGRYVNFEADDVVEAIYGKANFGRLVEVKNKYDPRNRFRMNQNIKPTV